MYSNLEGKVPIQVWVEPEMRNAVKLAARRAGLNINQAGSEAFEGWLEWSNHVELKASLEIARRFEEIRGTAAQEMKGTLTPA